MYGKGRFPLSPSETVGTGEGKYKNKKKENVAIIAIYPENF